MLGFDRRAAKYTWTAALILLLISCVYLIRESLILFAVSLLLTYLLIPLFGILNRVLPGRSRVPALALVYLILFGVLILMGMTIGSQVADEAQSLAQRAPDFLSNVQNQSAKSASSQGVKSIQQQVIGQLRAQLMQHYNEIVSLVPKFSMKVLSASRYLLLAIVVPIISFFMLKDGSMIREDMIDLFAPGRHRELVEDVVNDLHVLLLQYMRALFTLCLAVFGSFALALTLMGAPYALLLATIAFPLEFIPLVGPLSAAVIIMVVVTFAGFAHPLWVLAFLAIYRLFQDYVLSPQLMAAGVELHPLMVIFGVFAGGEIGGVAGIFLSIPILAMARIIIRRVRKQRIQTPEHIALT